MISSTNLSNFLTDTRSQYDECENLLHANPKNLMITIINAETYKKKAPANAVTACDKVIKCPVFFHCSHNFIPLGTHT